MLKLKTQLDIVKYSLWVQKFLRGRRTGPSGCYAWLLFTFNKASRRRAGVANSSVYCCSKRTN